MASTTTRVSMTIPISLVEDLNYISTKLKVSRSSLISEILSGTATPMRDILESTLALKSKTDESVLSRDPEKVRSYLDSLKSAVNASTGQLDLEIDQIYSKMDGLKNEH